MSKFVTKIGVPKNLQFAETAVTKWVNNLKANIKLPDYLQKKISVDKKTGATSSSTAAGQEIHNYIENEMIKANPKIKKEVTLNNGMRVDAIDMDKKIVYEVKPNNARGISDGNKQLNDYVKQLEKQYPNTKGKWKKELIRY